LICISFGYVYVGEFTLYLGGELIPIWWLFPW